MMDKTEGVRLVVPGALPTLNEYIINTITDEFRIGEEKTEIFIY